MIGIQKLWPVFLLGTSIYILELYYYHDGYSPTFSRSGEFSAKFIDVEYPYRFEIMPDSTAKCDNSTKLLIIVLTMAPNWEIRRAIRETWASRSVLNAIKVNFILSMSKNSTRIEEEARQHDDLIVTNLPETYDNLVLKVHSLLTYKQHYCDDVDYVLKIDEDVVINPEKVLEAARNPAKAKIDAISGYLWKKSVPKRDKSHKWYIPRTFWPAKYFPDYCDGPMYLVGKKVVPKLLQASQNHKKWSLEDVFWTGILTSDQKIPLFNWARQILRDKGDLYSNKLHCRASQPYLGCHGLKGPEQIRTGYQKLIQLKCT
ncbi:unnamed protein product [Caenorhabditis bovis]|uniref:Hexosyltransferase n=1 Tax=Caenorhabditis bovis TaxID=2654633 RepID=A0A8S1EEW4_9PELO|nr:unnamed protein product [Caenorhabditis bovis]